MKIIQRSVPSEAAAALRAAGLPELEARLYAARGVRRGEDLPRKLAQLLPYSGLKGIDAAAQRLVQAIRAQESVLIVADYDADGATACAVGMRGLRLLGAQVAFLVPNRFRHSYGLTPEIVHVAAARRPRLIVTVDNGIASLDGVSAAHAQGIEVLITDHHLPGEQLPAALIVNPNQPGCRFASKALSGVGVMFYLLMATRAALRAQGVYASEEEAPRLSPLLDLVALGTVADMVPLDANNRLLVEQGLARIRRGLACPGVQALLEVAGSNPAYATVSDLGFALGPRINAAGRLDDMRLGIDCLLADDRGQARVCARQLDLLNKERHALQHEMQRLAESTLARALAHLPAQIPDAVAEDAVAQEGFARATSAVSTSAAAIVPAGVPAAGSRHSLTVFDADFHPGVIGLVASRLKDHYHCPTVVFAPDGTGEGKGTLRGSGRSVPGLHLRDAFDLVAKRHPGLIARFGGHAAAAGLTLADAGQLTLFQQAFDTVCQHTLPLGALTRRWEIDGALAPGLLSLQLAERLGAQVWGQGFPPPLFLGRFRVHAQKVLAEKHLKLSVQILDGQMQRGDGQIDMHAVSHIGGEGDESPAAFRPTLRPPSAEPVIDAIYFHHADLLPLEITLVYQLGVNSWRGRRDLQLLVETVV